jgi:hypothetical protein
MRPECGHPFGFAQDRLARPGEFGVHHDRDGWDARAPV